MPYYFLRYNFVAIKKNIEIFSQLYTKRINYVDMIPFVMLEHPYFDNILSVNKECQLKYVAIFFEQEFHFFQAEDGIRDVERSRGLGDVYKRQM